MREAEGVELRTGYSQEAGGNKVKIEGVRDQED